MHSILLGRGLLLAWTGLWLGLKAMLFAHVMSERPKRTMDGSRLSWSPWQACSPALPRALMDILCSSASFHLADPMGLSGPAAALSHSDRFLPAEAPRYCACHQSTSKPQLSGCKPGLTRRQACDLSGMMPNGRHLALQRSSEC